MKMKEGALATLLSQPGISGVFLFADKCTSECVKGP